MTRVACERDSGRQEEWQIDSGATEREVADVEDDPAPNSEETTDTRVSVVAYEPTEMVLRAFSDWIETVQRLALQSRRSERKSAHLRTRNTLGITPSARQDVVPGDCRYDGSVWDDTLSHSLLSRKFPDTGPIFP